MIYKIQYFQNWPEDFQTDWSKSTEEYVEADNKKVVENYLERNGLHKMVKSVEDFNFCDDNYRYGAKIERDDRPKLKKLTFKPLKPQKTKIKYREYSRDEIELLRLYNAENAQASAFEDGESDIIADEFRYLIWAKEHGMTDKKVLLEMKKSFSPEEIENLIKDLTH